MSKLILLLVGLFFLSKQLNCQTIECGPSIDYTHPPNDCTKYYRCVNNQLKTLNCPRGIKCLHNEDNDDRHRLVHTESRSKAVMKRPK
jgi:hypothetical protein